MSVLFSGFQIRLVWQEEAGTSIVAAALGGGESWQVPEDEHKSVIIAGHEGKGTFRQ